MRSNNLNDFEEETLLYWWQDYKCDTSEYFDNLEECKMNFVRDCISKIHWTRAEYEKRKSSRFGLIAQGIVYEFKNINGDVIGNDIIIADKNVLEIEFTDELINVID